MLNIVNYIAILENADRILKNFGPDPDTKSSEFINAYSIYETAFAELMRTGIAYTVRGDTVVIGTDGKEYRYVYSDASGNSLSRTGIFDAASDSEMIFYRGSTGINRQTGSQIPAEDSTDSPEIILPPEMDEDEMEEESLSGSVPGDSRAEHPEYPAGTETEEGEEILTAEEEFGVEPEQADGSSEEEDGNTGSVSTVIGEEESESAGQDMNEETGNDGFRTAVEEPPYASGEPAAADYSYEDSTAGESISEISIPEEPAAPDYSYGDSAARESGPEEPHSTEPAPDESVPREPDFSDTEDIEPPSETEFGSMDMSEPAPEEETESEFGGGEETKSSSAIIEKVETEQDETPYESHEMPTSMAENDFTMSRHQLIFGRNGKEIGKTVVFTAPMSIDDPDTRIMVGILTNGKIAVYITERGKGSIKVNTRWIPIVVKGTMEDGEYHAACSITDDYERMGYRVTDMPAFFGKRGHIVMDDDQGKVHVHVFPALSKNLPNGLSHYCYCIEDNGKIQTGSSLKSSDSSGHVFFTANGDNYDMIATWDNGKFICYIKEV